MKAAYLQRASPLQRGKMVSLIARLLLLLLFTRFNMGKATIVQCKSNKTFVLTPECYLNGMGHTHNKLPRNLQIATTQTQLKWPRLFELQSQTQKLASQFAS